MTDSPTLDKLVNVSPRFARSVSLSRDSRRGDAIDGYILTPTGRNVMRRFAGALRSETPTRAWSITGPYGSGKSAFALLAAQALAGESWVRTKARAFLADHDAELNEQLFGTRGPLKKNARLCPVLVTGSRQPLEKALAASLAATLRNIPKLGRPPGIIEQLERMAEAPGTAGTGIVEMFEAANQYLAEKFSSEFAGILLIVDELGKFLEYGASNPDQGDVFVLQELAEAATRSERPFLFVTILHQAVDRYAEHMSASRRAEWGKVQGRFEDVPFEERTEQLLRLLAQAIRQEGDDAGLKQLRKQARAHAQDAAQLKLKAGAMPAAELQECVTAAYPLHPLTAMVLGPLFRQLAQNERSLFAFLASSEPFGFQDFLREGTIKAGPYRLDHLYDYVMTSLGPTLFAQHRGKLWAEVQSALDRLHDATELEVQLAKSIGLLQALGSASGIPASAVVLHTALKDADEAQGIDEAIQSLTRRGVAVFRRHTGSYALWEGSDVDLDDRLEAARQSVEQDQNLAAFLTREAPPQPLIARRHYFQTGTLRYFETCYTDRAALQADLFQGVIGADPGEADGRVIYCLPRDADDREEIRGMIATPSDIPVVVALPQDVFDLRELCHEVTCLRWVADNTPELEADRTARRELQARLAIAEQNLQDHLTWVFSPANGGCAWYYGGEVVKLKSQSQLNELLSKSCDDVYYWTPHWRNELINRRNLSSSAAAARRNLIEAMFESTGQEYLGFGDGHPPERSMHETLLQDTRLHRKQGVGFGIYPPDAKAEESVRELWRAIDRFMTETDSGRQSVAKLFSLLRRPPFGLKDGVLPVLLAAVLVHGHSQVALYEEGSFVPRPNAATFERIFRTPGKFELQRFRITGPRAEVFQQYAAMLSRADDETDLLTVVRPLVRTVKDLPDYVVKTRQIGETAQRVLKAMREARQPDHLLFTDLPAACGFPAFEAKGKVDASQVEAYFVQLRGAFAELQRAYPHLLAEVERLLLEAFGQEGPLAPARKEIEHQARLVLNVAVEAKLKAFLTRVADSDIEATTWLESIATLLSGKPLTHWDDTDRARFEVQLAATARTFEHFRSLAFEMEKTGFALLDGDPRLLRVSVTAPDAGELERVVQVPARLQQQAERAREQMLRILKDEGLLDVKDAGVAVLGELMRQLLAERDPKPTS